MTTKPTPLPLRFSDPLPNHAHVIQTLDTLGGRRYVLAWADGYQPFVTWEMNPTTRECFNGHYFGPDELEAAAADLKWRAGQ